MRTVEKMCMAQVRAEAMTSTNNTRMRKANLQRIQTRSQKVDTCLPGAPNLMLLRSLTEHMSHQELNPRLAPLAGSDHLRLQTSLRYLRHSTLAIRPPTCHNPLLSQVHPTQRRSISNQKPICTVIQMQTFPRTKDLV